MSILIIQENGRHEHNRNFRECFCLKRAFEYHDIKSDVWGLGHENYHTQPDWDSYNIVINLENYDDSGWVPSLSKVNCYKVLWSIDAHVRGIEPYLKTAHDGNYDLILQATPEFLTANSIWFPNCYDDELISKLNIPKIHKIGFCGNINNRGHLINVLMSRFNLELNEFVIGHNMVRAINSYEIHFNANIGIDINYRNFETIGCGTCLLTSYNKHYQKLGFIDKYNCLTYSNIDEMIDKAEWAISHPREIERLSKNGLKLAQKHTYRYRINSLMEYFNI